MAEREQRGPMPLPPSATSRSVRSARPVTRGGPAPRTQPATRKSGFRLCGRIIASLAILGIVSFAAVYVRLLQGPISLAFLVGPIESAINSQLDGVSVDMDDAVMRLADNGRIEFRLMNLRITDGEGAPLAASPFAAVRLSRRAMVTGRIVPARVELIEPELLLTYDDSGKLAVRFTRTGVSEGRPGKRPPLKGGAGERPDAPETVLEKSVTPSPAPGDPRLDMGRLMAEMMAKVRRGGDGASYLHAIGLRGATVIFEHRGQRSLFRVPELDAWLVHRQKRSTLRGAAKVQSATGPWALNFKVDDSEKARRLSVEIEVKDLVPHSLERVPGLAALNALEMPVNADGRLEITTEGVLEAATLNLSLGAGRLLLPWIEGTPLAVDNGRLELAYARESGRVDVTNAALAWGGSHVILSGRIESAPDQHSSNAWRFALAATEGIIALSDEGSSPARIDKLSTNGQIYPDDGIIRVERLDLATGGAEVVVAGLARDTGERSSAHFEGRVGALPVGVLKALWPRALAPGARMWIRDHVQRGRIVGGTFKLVSPERLVKSGAPAEPRLSLALEAADVATNYIDDLPALDAPRVLIQFEGSGLEVTVPDAQIAVGQGRRLTLKQGRFTVVDLDQELPTGEVAFRLQAQLPAMLDYLDREPFGFVRAAGLETGEGIEGRVEGQLKATFPLLAKLKAEQVRFEGKARVMEGRMRRLFRQHDFTGVTVTFDIAEKAIDAKGEGLIAGVTARLSWQHIFGAPVDKQPPFRLRAVLDNADRTQLGLDVNHLVLGEVPVELTVTRTGREEPIVQFRADLTRSEVIFENVAWSKPPGSPASLQFDITKGKAYKVELTEFKMRGDNAAIEGWLGLSADGKVREFSFPEFSVNVVTRLAVRGKLRDDGVWDVKAAGKTYDGQQLFRSLFSIGRVSERQPDPPRAQAGVDLTADIDTVLGFSDASARGVRVVMKKRGGRMTALDARATLEGGKPLVALLRQAPGGPRMLLAETQDAGLAFRLVGFYPNVRGGHANLEVNLDGVGAAEKAGTLWVKDFIILGEAVVTEVTQADEGRPAIGKSGTATQRRAVRQRLDFDQMKIPFSVGHGQFVLSESYLKGPIIGASLRGKVDFKTRTVDLGGTYVPLAGLNSALCMVPLLGQILTGPNCEGIIGITYSIQGRMEDPQVIANPLSIVTPGIFREIFQMTPYDPRVLPRDEGTAARPKTGSAPGVRASSAPPASQGKAPPQSKQPPATPRIEPEVGGGWSVDTRARRTN